MASKHLCQPCETEKKFVPAIKWCRECEENLCKDCFQFHKKIKATKKHHVADIIEAYIFPSLADQYCSKHSCMLLDLFCVDHDSLSCRQCMTEDHRACSQLLPLDVAAKDVRSSALVSDVVNDLEHSVVSFCSIETAIGNALKEVEDQRLASNKSITALKIHLQNQIEESASVLSKQIDRDCRENRLSLQEQEHSFKDSKIVYIKRKEELEKVIKHGSNNQIFILAHQLKLLQTKEDASFIDKCKQLDRIEIHFPEKHELPSFSSFDDISIEKTPLNVNARSSKAQVAETILYDDAVKTLYHKSTNVFQSSINGIAVTKQNNVLICLQNDCTVSRCFPEGNVDKSCKAVGKVCNVCVIDETDEAVITLPEIGKIQFLKYIPMKAGKTVDTFPNPCSIMLCKNKLVVGTFNKMQFFTKDGSPLHIVNVSFEDCMSICYMHPGDRNRIYMSRSSFYAITDSGNMLFKHSEPLKRRTNGICIDRDGNVYVASQNSVVRLSKKGKVLDQNILDKANDYDKILGIAFNRTYTQMYAATDDGFKLTIFDFR